MRRARHLLALLVGLHLAWPAVALADFNPWGRKRKSAKQATSTRSSSKAKRRPVKAKTSSTKVKGGANDKTRTQALIRRYTAVVLSQPGAAFPLSRLADLYRKRDGNLDKLLRDFEQRRRDSKSPSEQYALTISLAGFYAQAGRDAEAIALFEAGINTQPNNPVGLLALAELHQRKNRQLEAAQLLERAIAHLKNGTDKELRQRELLELYLELHRFAAAKQVHQQLVKRAKGSFFVRAELGRALLDRQQYGRAEVELRELVKAVRGDYRAEAPALKDLARALLGQGKTTAAIDALNRALRTTQRTSGVRRELLELSVRAHRSAGSLPTFIRTLEQNSSADPLKTTLLAGLYEESGQLDNAVKFYKRALARRPKDVDLHLKLINLFNLKGELQVAANQYAKLVRVSPENPQFVFDWVNALLQLGKRNEALAQLRKLESRSQQDEQTGAALVEFYEQLGEREQSLRLLKRLASGVGKDPAHLIELGNRYYELGETDKAKRTWEKLLVVVSNRARALHLLGGVYAEHDIAEPAIKALTEASKLQPLQLRYQKSLALALERTGTTAPVRVQKARYEQALKIWQTLLAKADPTGALASEARNHIVTLWTLSGASSQRVASLGQRLRRTPPDVEAGRLLAELHIRKQRYQLAEATLRELLKTEPGDVGSHLRLERVLLLQRKLPEAVVVLEKLTQLAPKRARQFYRRMAKYSAELYQDDDALKYAALAVSLSPDDAEGHFRLAEMYETRREPSRAEAEYRQAIAQNDRLFDAYFRLAELLVNQGKLQEVDRLYARVMRHAVDDETIDRAIRARFHIHLTRGSLQTIEQDLLPLALSKPQKAVYRRSLIEIYGAMTFPLVQRAQLAGTAATHLLPNPEELAKQAKEQLQAIGRRAVKPLLDALSDETKGAQQTALQLLTHVSNPGANTALFAYATGSSDGELRARAMLATGATEDPKMLSRYERLLRPNGYLQVDEGDPVSLAAVWGIARQDSKAARRLQLQILQSDAPAARAIAALALGARRVARAGPALLDLAQSTEAGPRLRGAIAYALGRIDPPGAVSALIALAEAPEPQTRSLALASLAQLGEGRKQVAEAVFSSSRVVSEAAASAASLIAGHAYATQGRLFEVPDKQVQVQEMLLSVQPAAAPPEARAKGISVLQGELSDAARGLAQGTVADIQRLARALRAEHQQLSLGPLTDGLSSQQRSASLSVALSAVHRTAAKALLARWPDADLSLKTTIVGVVSHAPELSEARTRVVQALESEKTEMETAALSAIANFPHRDFVMPLLVKLEALNERAWVRRVRLLETLARAHAAAKGWSDDPLWSKTAPQLSRLALSNRYAIVREAALKALAQLAPSAAAETLRQASEGDPAPAVRRLAQKLL